MSEEKKEIVEKKIFELKNGQIELESFDQQLKFANMLIQKKLISESFKDAGQVVIAIQTCKALGLEPIIGLKMLYVVGGKPSLYGDGPLSLVASSGKLESIEEFYIDEKCNRICIENKNITAEVFGAVCRTRRVGDNLTQEDYFTRNDRKASNLNSPVWSRYEKAMMRYRARGANLKSKFSDLLNGLDIAEYTHEDAPQFNIINKTASEEINEAFKEG